MKLSEAIRLGSMLGPQAFGVDHHVVSASSAVTGGPKVARCVVWSARHAIGLRDDSNERTVGAFPVLLVRAPCPEGDNSRQQTLFSTVVHLNDHHRWTREAIADFVERIENEQEAIAPNVPTPAEVTG